MIKSLSSLLNGVKVVAFAWYSVKIRFIFGVQFERRKVDEKQIYMKTETCKLYSRAFWIFLPNFINLILTILIYTVSKLVHFLRLSVETFTKLPVTSALFMLDCADIGCFILKLLAIIKAIYNNNTIIVCFRKLTIRLHKINTVTI